MLGIISARKNDNRASMCGVNSCEWNAHKGVRELRNVLRQTLGREGRASSIEQRESKRISWVVSDVERYDMHAWSVASRTCT